MVVLQVLNMYNHKLCRIIVVDKIQTAMEVPIQLLLVDVPVLVDKTQSSVVVHNHNLPNDTK